MQRELHGFTRERKAMTVPGRRGAVVGRIDHAPRMLAVSVSTWAAYLPPGRIDRRAACARATASETALDPKCLTMQGS